MSSAAVKSVRAGLSVRARFEIFKRDGFRCKYCGAVPSDTVILEIDHVKPIAKGGTNDPDNLVTACFSCNRGKSNVPLGVVSPSMETQAELVREREAQIRAYHKIMEKARERKAAELWTIAGMFMDRFALESMWRDDLGTIKLFLSKLDFFEVQEAMEIATLRSGGRQALFKYFCGICWNKIKTGN